ncbi:MAG: aldehyde dehydrogenase family protein, partial [Gammaproteobacteria bacterium]|nr:aldehyde dehydrogenase family protein [Gammaproteobacteria bacterium]
SALALAALAEEAGFPKGVFNIVTGDPQAIGLELSTHPWVRKLSFTGSTRVGKLLMKQAADTVKKLSLELGGNAPFIVFEDADLDAAIEGLMASKFRNAGQTCICANRIFVQENVLDAFVKKLKPAVAALKVGNGLNNPEQGPLINKAAVTKVLGLIEDAEALGAHLLVGGKKAAESDFCIQPTLMTGITSKMKIAHEEIFGPVIGIQTFKSDAEVIKHANHTPFGLASYFFSRDLSRVWRVAEALEYGMVGINTGLISNEMCPFGGVKESGFGREGSKYGLDDYLVIKYICMAGV